MKDKLPMMSFHICLRIPRPGSATGQEMAGAGPSPPYKHVITGGRAPRRRAARFYCSGDIGAQGRLQALAHGR